jgi:hypothetical protein
MELMSVKAKDLPPLALEFRGVLCREVGMCMETCITAFACYAQAVEGLECHDDLYQIRPDHSEWFAKRLASQSA